MNNPTCPICGATLRKQGRGATSRKHGPRYICPVAEAEVITDADGRMRRIAGAKHDRTQVWTLNELNTSTSH